MKRILTFCLLICLIIPFNLKSQDQEEPQVGCHFTKQKVHCEALTEEQERYVRATKARSDTFNILNYDIRLNVTDFANKRISGHCIVKFTPKMDNLDFINLDLEALTTDSVLQDGLPISFDIASPFLKVNLNQTISIGDTVSLDIYYRGTPITSSSGFGGFYFEDNIAYNLGIGLNDSPHNYGRAWYPCFDNFVERATYDFTIIAPPGMKGYAIGEFIDETVDLDNRNIRRYRMNQLLPTYLTGIAVSTYTSYEFVYDALDGPIPVRLVGKPAQMNNFKESFQQLGDAIDVFEKWYGPYIWSHVGYVLTTRGAMEHSTSIAYPASSVDNGKPSNRLMSHELCHHWWGNMLSPETQADMWIKEGNAEYGAHLFVEYTEGTDAFAQEVKANNLKTIKTAHLDDDGYKALSPMPQEQTYGTTTYNKGAAMIHNMRAFLQDSLFASGQRKMLEDNLYANLNAHTYQEQMSLATGVDMTDYFNNWVFNPGWADYEIDSLRSTQSGGDWQVQTFVQQKLRGTSQIHKQDPVWVRFIGSELQYEDRRFVADEEFSEFDVTIPFQPVAASINPDNHLNIASFVDGGKIYTGKTFSSGNTRISLDFNKLVDTSLLYVEHHWTAPDPMLVNPQNIQLSSTSYWNVVGIIHEGSLVKANINYSKGNELDNELLLVNEDSLLLMYRPDASAEWSVYAHYVQWKFSPTDGNGFLKIDELLPGQYALAKGPQPISATDNLSTATNIQLFPNPAQEEIYLSSATLIAGTYQYKVFGLQRQLFQQGLMQNVQGDPAISIKDLPEGHFYIQLIDVRSGKVSTAAFQKF
ncbi:MAG: M1 family metallopeptidase [Saprospiraceae bacterium]